MQLPANQFDSVVRWIKNSNITVVQQMFGIVDGGMKRLGCKPNARKAIKGTPAGSDQTDIGSLRDWVATVGAQDFEARSQLIAMHATLKARLEA